MGKNGWRERRVVLGVDFPSKTFLIKEGIELQAVRGNKVKQRERDVGKGKVEEWQERRKGRNGKVGAEKVELSISGKKIINKKGNIKIMVEGAPY